MAKNLTMHWSYYCLESLKKERCPQKSNRSSRFFICSENHGGASSGYEKFITAFYIRVQTFARNFLKHWIGYFPFRTKYEIMVIKSPGLAHLQQADLALDKLLLESTGSSMTRKFKVGLSSSKKNFFICFNDGPSKMMKNAFHFILKVLFVLKIFKFLS